MRNAGEAEACVVCEGERKGHEEAPEEMRQISSRADGELGSGRLGSTTTQGRFGPCCASPFAVVYYHHSLPGSCCYALACFWNSF